MGFLVCEDCGEFYEVKEGNSLDHIPTNCPCGGRIVFKNSLNNSRYTEEGKTYDDTLNDIKTELHELKKESKKEKSSDILSSLILGFIALVVGGWLIFLGIGLLLLFFSNLYAAFVDTPFWAILIIIAMGALIYYLYPRYPGNRTILWVSILTILLLSILGWIYEPPNTYSSDLIMPILVI